MVGAEWKLLSQIPVDVFSVCNADDKNDEDFFPDSINDSIIA